MNFLSLFIQVSATFAASLITSPALGAYLGTVYGDSVVIALATAISLLDILFILVCVPESLPERLRPVSWGKSIPWEKADPFSVSLKYLPLYKGWSVSTLFTSVSVDRICVKFSSVNSFASDNKFIFRTLDFLV